MGHMLMDECLVPWIIVILEKYTIRLSDRFSKIENETIIAVVL